MIAWYGPITNRGTSFLEIAAKSTREIKIWKWIAGQRAHIEWKSRFDSNNKNQAIKKRDDR